MAFFAGLIVGVIGAVALVVSLNVFVTDKTWLLYLGAWESLAVSFSAVTAVAYYVFVSKDTRSKFHFDRAMQNLKDFHNDVETNLIEASNGFGQIPKNDRLLWLNFEQTIISFSQHKENMKPHQLEDFRAEEMRSRRHLSKYFEDEGHSSFRFDMDYFSDGVENFSGWSPGTRDPLSEDSVATVYLWLFDKKSFDHRDRGERFEQSRQEREGTRKSLSDAEIENIESFGPTGFARFLRAHREWRDQLTTRSR